MREGDTYLPRQAEILPRDEVRLEEYWLRNEHRTRGLRCGDYGDFLQRLLVNTKKGEGEGLYSVHGLTSSYGKNDWRCPWTWIGNSDYIHRARQRLVDASNTVTLKWTLAHSEWRGTNRTREQRRRRPSPPENHEQALQIQLSTTHGNRASHPSVARGHREQERWQASV